MILGSPDRTPYDLQFRFLGIPVRVHPMFWLVMVLISGSNTLKHAAIFIACAFVSILIHELGHGLSSRAVGNEPVGIVLYAMGGYCQFMRQARSAGQRLFVLLMGPGAGFALLGLVLALAQAYGGVRPLDAMALVGVGQGNRIEVLNRLAGWTEPAYLALVYLLEINFWWGVLNLLPIWPLDGGQAAGVVLGVVNPRHGTRWTHVLSLLTAGLIALWWASRDNPQYMMALWFGYFAFVNYQVLQSLQNSYGFPDESEWWR
jgi:stage IV sporulation protein FB